MINVVLAPNIINNDKYVVFLAGPIQGTNDWQKDAINFLEEELNDITIANPRNEYINEEFDYDKQVDWETKYLNRASKKGVILFWLANEKEHLCNRAYAQTTRFELAEWKTKHQYNNDIQIVVGIDSNFSNSRYIRKRLIEDCPKIEICDSLEKTCKKVAQIIRNKEFNE